MGNPRFQSIDTGDFLDGQIPAYSQVARKFQPSNPVTPASIGALTETEANGLYRLISDSYTKAETTSTITAAFAAFVGMAPTALDTWGELVAQIQADETGLAALTTVVGAKASTASLNAEITRATTAETLNASAISDEATRAQAAEALKTDKSVSILAWAYGENYQLLNGTRNSNGALTSADIVWPDGATGHFTADTLSTAWPSAIDAYHVTHVLAGVTTTYTGTITRDATTGGAISHIIT